MGMCPGCLSQTASEVTGEHTALSVLRMAPTQWTHVGFVSCLSSLPPFIYLFIFTRLRTLLMWAICQNMEMQISCSHIKYFPENIPENLHVSMICYNLPAGFHSTNISWVPVYASSHDCRLSLCPGRALAHFCSAGLLRWPVVQVSGSRL